jgi:mannosyltransferase OCH1-like enzyme
MGIVMRIIQQFHPGFESEFMALEKKFDELEKKRTDYPKGKRMQPISAHEPINTLIWQYEFPDIETAYKTLNFFSGDESHEELFRRQVPFMKEVRVEFYKTLDYES